MMERDGRKENISHEQLVSGSLVVGERVGQQLTGWLVHKDLWFA
jgi:hypothetical protein